jgi:hypothetical protein
MTKVTKTDHSQQRLSDLEILITANQPDFYAVGKALIEIRDSTLYQLKFNTFVDYTQNKWDMSRNHAYRMIRAAQVLDCLLPIGNIVPKNEAQARPLTVLSRSDLKEVWLLFIQSKQALIAINIRRFVLDYLKQHGKTAQGENLISEEYHQAVQTMLYQIQINQNKNWQDTSRKTALYWTKIMREKIVWKCDE